jgi:hypothetical protein
MFLEKLLATPEGFRDHIILSVLRIRLVVRALMSM